MGRQSPEPRSRSTSGRSPVRESRTPGSARGGRGTPAPYRYRPPDRVVAGSVNDLQFHDLLFQQLQRPPLATLRRFGTGQGNQLRFGDTVKDAWSGRGWRMLADEHGIEAFSTVTPF